ncbi:MAG TPA: nucleotidyltransferase family protein [Pyrinomonadaceae bacterium]|jgi:predicted nucleotidyltransferase|nr:nucleotidyltransferase family protein [Pyrinomonadaceae bacterium]
MTVRTKEDVFALLRQNGEQLRRFGVGQISLFGSFARGEASDESDVDILVELEAGGKSFDNFLALAEFLEELFGRKVDLLTPESLNPRFGHYILSEAEHATINA